MTNRGPQPHPDLQALDRLVGTWQVTGGARGQMVYEWMPGRFFLMQRIDFQHGQNSVQGLEIIGSPAHCQGSFSTDGNTLEGAWVFPGGGGYSSTATRVRP
jgi:hypothetical protein